MRGTRPASLGFGPRIGPALSGCGAYFAALRKRCHDRVVTEYSWPDRGSHRGGEDAAVKAWNDIVRELPAGSPIAGEVIGRQPFGVFVRIDKHPDAVGLAEITVMPRHMRLPRVGDRVTGSVLGHADHNRQVRITLTEWFE